MPCPEALMKILYKMINASLLRHSKRPTSTKVSSRKSINV